MRNKFCIAAVLFIPAVSQAQIVPQQTHSSTLIARQAAVSPTQPSETSLIVDLVNPDGVRAREPVLLRVTYVNKSAHKGDLITFCNNRSLMHFDVFSAGGQMLTQVEPPPPQAFDYLCGGVSLSPGESKSEIFGLARRYSFDTPGNYSVRVWLGSELGNESQSPILQATVPLTVLPYDRDHLDRLCLFLAAREQGKNAPPFKIRSEALYAVRDDVALPYWDEMAKWWGSSHYLAPLYAMRRLDTPKAQARLKQLAARSDELGKNAREVQALPLSKVPSFSLIKTVIQDAPPAVSPGAKEPAETGEAIVLNRAFAPQTVLPTLAKLASSPPGTARDLRALGFQVATTPGGRCIAAAAVRPTKATTLKQLLIGSVSDEMLAAIVANGLTKKQLTTLEQGYLWPENMTPLQREAAYMLGRRQGALDARNRPKNKEETRFGLGIQSINLTLLTGRAGDAAYAIDAFPPAEMSSALMSTSPTGGSTLWWLWPESRATWGQKPISLPPGNYQLPALLAKLSTLSGLKIQLEKGECCLDEVGVDDRHPQEIILAAQAQRMPLRRLIWAVCVAAGLHARIEPANNPQSIVFSVRPARPFVTNYHNALLSLGQGIPSPLQNAVVREFLQSAKGPKTIPLSPEKSIWQRPLSEFALLYRQAYETRISQTLSIQLHKTGPLEPASVLSTQALSLSVETLTPQFAGGGSAVVMPVF